MASSRVLIFAVIGYSTISEDDTRTLFFGGGGKGGTTRCIMGVVQMYNNYFCMRALFISDKTEDQVCKCHVMYNGQLS